MDFSPTVAMAHLIEPYLQPESSVIIPLFQKLESSGFNRERGIVAYRDYVLTMDTSILGTDDPKNQEIAALCYEEGHKLILDVEYRKALEKYNEGICWAQPGSQQIAQGYAGRSEAYFELGEFEYALMNINLARKHGHVASAELESREKECRDSLLAGKSKNNDETQEQVMNVEVHPRIPHLASGIHMEILPELGRGLITEREFVTGDIILQEKPMLASVDKLAQYLCCSHCSSPIMPNMVPCQNCTAVLYCSELCLKNNEFVHKFECGISNQLKSISFHRTGLGPKMFFYGLSLLDGDLDKFSAFCEANPRTGSDPLGLDFTNLDRLEEFKMFHTAELPFDGFNYKIVVKLATALFYSVYIKHPPVAAIFTTERHKLFLLNCIWDYIRTACLLGIGHTMPRNRHTAQHFTIASLCNHSCYPNTMALYHAGQLKLIVLRRIPQGEQITIAYIPPIEEIADKAERIRKLESAHIERCICYICNSMIALLVEMMSYTRNSFNNHPDMEGDMKKIFEDDAREQLESLRRFCAKYLGLLPCGRMDVYKIVDLYRFNTACQFKNNVEQNLRRAAANENGIKG